MIAYLRGGPLHGRVMRLPGGMTTFEVIRPSADLGEIRPDGKPVPVQFTRGRYVRQPKGTGLLSRLGGSVYFFTGWYTLS